MERIMGEKNRRMKCMFDQGKSAMYIANNFNMTEDQVIAFLHRNKIAKGYVGREGHSLLLITAPFPPLE